MTRTKAARPEYTFDLSGRILGRPSTERAAKYDAAMNVTTQARADAYVKRLLVGVPKKHRAEADRFERTEIAYHAGYFDAETRKQVERVFRCAHPILGAIAENSPTPQECFLLGLEMGRKRNLN